MVIHCLLCTALTEILKQLSFHPGNDELLSYIIDLSFKRFLAKDIAPSFSTYAQQNQLYLDNQFVTDLYAEVIGCIAQHRFALVKRRFVIEFTRLKLNISPLSNANSTAQGSAAQGSSTSTMQTSSASMSDSETQGASGGVSASQNNPVVGNQSAIAASSASLTASFISPTSANIIKLFMGMKHFRIKMVPIEDFEVQF
jgi:hypothetical protein